MAWRLARSLETLRGQLDARWPDRDRKSDGTIGDLLHAGQGGPTFNVAGYGVSGTDHLPDRNEIVCAYDIDTDIAPGITAHDVADAIAASNDRRIGYIISNGRIWSTRSGALPGAWRPYSGTDPHDTHVHVSVRHTTPFVDSPARWQIEPSTPTATPPQKDDDMLILTADGKSWLLSGGKAAPIANGADYTAIKLAGVPEAKVSQGTVDAWL